MVTEQERYLVERLRAVVPVESRRMFGGLGLYHEGLFFGLVAGERLYLKVDDATRARFDARECAAFQPFPDRPASLAYREPPEDVVSHAGRLRPWLEDALAAARRAATRRAAQERSGTGRSAKEHAAKERSAKEPRAGSRGGTARAAKASRTKAPPANASRANAPATNTSRANTIGATTPSAERDDDPRTRIQNLGPVSRRHLAAVGVHSFSDLRARGSVAVFRAVRARGLESSANLLYALEAALLGLRWDRLPDVVKQNLRERAGIARNR